MRFTAGATIRMTKRLKMPRIVWASQRLRWWRRPTRLLLPLLLLWKQLSCQYGAECCYRVYEKQSYKAALLT